MNCRLTDLRQKQVICMKNGELLGSVGDVEVDTCSGCVVNLVLYGRPRFFGLFGRCEDIILPFSSVEVIGQDAMLVSFEPPAGHTHRSWWSRLFRDSYRN